MNHKITLSLTAHHYARLIEMAGETSADDKAQQLLLQALDGEAVASQIGAHFQQFEAQIRDLRESISVSTQVLMVSVGKVPVADAKLWASMNIGS